MAKEYPLDKYIEVIETFLEDPEHSPYSDLEVAKALKKIAQEEPERFGEYLKKIPNEFLGDIALELPEKYLRGVIDHLPNKDLVEVVQELESDDATDLLQDIEEIDQDKAEKIFSSLDKEDQKEITRLKSYEEDEAGAHMQTELFSANIDEKILDAISRLKRLKKEGELENIHQVFITGTFNKLMFTVPLEDLLTFDFEKSFREELTGREEDFKPIIVRDTDDIKEVAHLFREHDLSVVPVVNEQNELVGRITSDDIYDIIQESATEQIYNLAGVDDEAEEEENIVEAGKKRGIWLFVNLLTAILASIVIQMFDQTIQAYVALAVLMPIVASMGGNAGTQTLTVTVRRLALGEIDLSHAKETIKKEVLLSLANGFVFAVVLGLIALIWFKQPLLGLVIGASMIINLFAAGFFGAVIPLVLKRLHIDPAVGSTVILTTVTDVVGFFSFLGLASWILVK
ncbi:MAG: magnesium transporter [Campylobacteraceae bacterium 4484_4]|nr:MAG: magnesium transporter [Campylobacteraceae bacterium 4484_4]